MEFIWAGKSSMFRIILLYKMAAECDYSDRGERHIPMQRIYRPHPMIAFVNSHIIPDATLYDL